MICAILYLEKSDKARFANLKKRVENDYVPNKAEYPRTVTAWALSTQKQMER